MAFLVEEVYRTEGIPEFTFVPPPNYNEILVDIRTTGKPVIIEGQSGTGKTTTVRKITELSLPNLSFEYLSARKGPDLDRIHAVATGNVSGSFIIDDFHRLNEDVQRRIADVVKLAAEEPGTPQYPKIVIIGINKVGSELIHLVHDIAKRCGIHRVQTADREATFSLITRGEEKLNITIPDKDFIFSESRGDYWLTQALCHTICIASEITQTANSRKDLHIDAKLIRDKIATRLQHGYYEAVKEFCRGRRFRPTNDPYFKLLKAVSEQESSIVDVTMLANQNQDVRGSINNIKETRLNILLESKPECDRHFYYNRETKNFAIEDPALFYYLKHLDWDRLRTDCGFKIENGAFDFDFALSFAGENRNFARMIARQLETLDCTVFFDENFETNFLGTTWSKQFADIFGQKARFVVPILDHYHLNKIWPTFEREHFAPRVKEAAVIPVFLDDSVFPGIPKDLVGIVFRMEPLETLANRITDDIVFKLYDHLEKA